MEGVVGGLWTGWLASERCVCRQVQPAVFRIPGPWERQPVQGQQGPRHQRYSWGLVAGFGFLDLTGLRTNAVNCIEHVTCSPVPAHLYIC